MVPRISVLMFKITLRHFPEGRHISPCASL